MIRYLVVNQELNQSTADYVADISTALQAAGAVGVQSVFITRRLDYQTVRFATTLSITDPGPAQVRAAYFSSLAGTPVDTQVDAFFAANPTYRAIFVRDVSQEIRRKLDHDAVMVIYIESLIPNCGQDRSRPVIVEALEAIAAGATGQVQLVGASGLEPDVFTVTNRSAFTILETDRAYAQVAPGTCDWDAYGTCCNAAAPVNLVEPTIEGVGYVDYTLTGDAGTWSGAATLTYQYQYFDGVDWLDIPGATAIDYGPFALAYQGLPVRLQVTGSNLAGSTVAVSNVIEQWVPSDAGADPVQWYDAFDPATLSVVGAAVTAWGNKGTAGSSLATAVGSQQPIYNVAGFGGFPTVTWSAGNRLFRLLDDNTAQNVAGCTVAAMCIPALLTGSSRHIYGSSTNSSTATRAGIRFNVANVQAMGRRLDADTLMAVNIGTAILSTKQSYLALLNYGSAQAFGLVNGVESAPLAFQTAGNTSNTPSARRMAGTSLFGSDDYAGNTSELIQYNILLDATNRAKLAGYLAWKWRAVTELSGASPYKTVPPTP